MSASPVPPGPTPASRLPALPAVPGWARMVVLAGILTVLAWPIANLPAKATLDGSWQIALHLAAGLGLRHGVAFFTYGPLGFLGFPIPYLDLTSTVALTVSIAIYLALIGTMLVEARRLLPLWAAFVVTLLVARIFVLLPPFEAFQALIFIWCVEALADRIPLPTSALAAIGGVLAGAAVLGKVSVGSLRSRWSARRSSRSAAGRGARSASSWSRPWPAAWGSGLPPANTSRTSAPSRAASTRSSRATTPRWAATSWRSAGGSTWRCRPWPPS